MACLRFNSNSLSSFALLKSQFIVDESSSSLASSTVCDSNGRFFVGKSDCVAVVVCSSTISPDILTLLLGLLDSNNNDDDGKNLILFLFELFNDGSWTSPPSLKELVEPWFKEDEDDADFRTVVGVKVCIDGGDGSNDNDNGVIDGDTKSGGGGARDAAFVFVGSK